jgi:hypothetical protein
MSMKSQKEKQIRSKYKRYKDIKKNYENKRTNK